MNTTYSVRKLISTIACIITLIAATPLHSEDLSEAPAKIQAGIFFKLFSFNKNLSGDVSVFVLNNEDLAAKLKKAIGKKIGASKLASVESGTSVPNKKYDIIYSSDATQLSAVIAYSRKNKSLSITGNPELVSKGITLGVGLLNKKPKILLNISSSKEEGINWNPAILKVAMKM